ncbi:MAG TPA: hypothetical protein VIW03_09430 [Anaeromyxobacter sp.]
MSSVRRSAIAVAAVLAACAGDRAEQTAGASIGAASPSRRADHSPSAELEKSLAKTASGAQAGTVREVEGGRLVLAPYEPRLGNTTIQLDGAGPVFRDGERISIPARDALLPGMDVKVFLGGGGAEAPRVLGVKILSDAEAREMRAAVEHQPQLLDKDRSGGEQHGGVAWQAGRIRELRADALVVEPYERGAANTELRVEGEFDVYRGTERVGRESLRPGADVRVYFDERTGTARVLGVEILKDEDARRERGARK